MCCWSTSWRHRVKKKRPWRKDDGFSTKTRFGAKNALLDPLGDATSASESKHLWVCFQLKEVGCFLFFCFFLPGCFRHWKTSLRLCPWIAAELERDARISDLKASISNPLDKVGFAINTWWKMRGFKDGIPFLEDAKSQLGQLFPRPDSSYHFYLTLFYFSGLFLFSKSLLCWPKCDIHWTRLQHS